MLCTEQERDTFFFSIGLMKESNGISHYYNTEWIAKAGSPDKLACS